MNSLFLFLSLLYFKLNEGLPQNTTAVAVSSGVHLRAKRQWGGCCPMPIMPPMCCMPRMPMIRPMMMIPRPMPPPMPMMMMSMRSSCCGCCVPVCMPMCMRGGCGCGGGMGMFGRKKREALIRSNAPVLRLEWKH